MSASTRKPATYADLEAVPEHLVAEIIAGTLYTRSHGHAEPAMVRGMLSLALRGVRQSRVNPNAAWQVVTLPELHLGNDVLVPELAAWSVSRMPYLRDEHSKLPPDWACEFVDKNPHRNPALTRKLDIYRINRVRHVWLLDLTARQIRLMDGERSTASPIMTADHDDVVRAPPFDAISFSLADLWPLDPPLGMNEDPTPYYAGDR